MLDGKVRGLWGEVVLGMFGEMEGGEEVGVGAEGTGSPHFARPTLNTQLSSYSNFVSIHQPP
jgi:hypothetical protein